MEKLHELHQEGSYDLLVLDTPPTRNALDFLDAPRRLARFIDSRSLQLLPRVEQARLRASSGRGSGMLFSVMKRATGVDLLKDLADFFNSFGDMADGFRERAERVNALIGDHRTTFLLVTSPRAASIEEAAYFHRKLRNEDLPFGGVIVNRMREPVQRQARAQAREGADRPARREAGRQGEPHPAASTARWPSATPPTWSGCGARSAASR